MEGIINGRLALIDQRFDDLIKAAMSPPPGSNLPTDESLERKRFACFYLARKLVFYGGSLDNLVVTDRILLSARRALLSAVSETEVEKSAIVDKEWLNRFITQVQRQEINPVEGMRYVLHPPLIN